MAKVTITYTGTDVLFCDRFTEKGVIQRVAIACTKKAEDALYNWQIKYHNTTGKEIGTLRTVFGLSFYPQDLESIQAMEEFVREKNLDFYYGHV
jgi:hypothetical protein